MTDLDETYIKKFKEAYQGYFGEQITDKEASERFFKLANLFRVIIYGAPINNGDQFPSGNTAVDDSNSSANID